MLIARHHEPILIGNGQENLTFNSNDVGENIVGLFAQDEAGNWNYSWTTVIVQGGEECSSNVLNAPSSFIQMTVPVVEPLTPENLIFGQHHVMGLHLHTMIRLFRLVMLGLR